MESLHVLLHVLAVRERFRDLLDDIDAVDRALLPLGVMGMDGDLVAVLRASPDDEGGRDDGHHRATRRGRGDSWLGFAAHVPSRFLDALHPVKAAATLRPGSATGGRGVVETLALALVLIEPKVAWLRVVTHVYAAGARMGIAGSNDVRGDQRYAR
jgi:hypothetical protein